MWNLKFFKGENKSCEKEIKAGVRIQSISYDSLKIIPMARGAYDKNIATFFYKLLEEIGPFLTLFVRFS
jgi:hypothetical protein